VNGTYDNGCRLFLNLTGQRPWRALFRDHKTDTWREAGVAARPATDRQETVRESSHGR